MTLVVDDRGTRVKHLFPMLSLLRYPCEASISYVVFTYEKEIKKVILIHYQSVELMNRKIRSIPNEGICS